MTDSTTSKREYYPLRPIDVVAIVAFWSVLAFISAAGRELDPRIPGIPGPVMTAVVTVSFVEYALWAVITIGIWWLASRYSIEGGRRFGRVLLFIALGFGLAILMDTLLFHLREWLISPVGRFRRRPPVPFVGLAFLDDLMVYFAVLGAGIARDYFLRYRARVEETIRLQAQLALARLDVLRSQLNPHFLFNTLNAVSALVDRDPRGARRMIARLSDLLRYTLEEGTEQEVPLHRELDLLDEYIELMQIRFQGRLNVKVRVEDGVRSALVPNLVLQPIVENAMKHGVAPAAGSVEREGEAAEEREGKIDIGARRVGDDLVITVADNGPGPGNGGEGVGLTNTNARLRELYGARYRVTLKPGTQRGTEAEIMIPYHTTVMAPRAG
jgi:two-component system, LytTR family, sensor kinase